MKSPFPKAKTIRAFLAKKGWSLKDKTSKYYIFLPPPDFTFEDGFNLKIPVFENAKDYERYTTQIIEFLADLYEIDFNLLLQVLSKSPAENRKEIENQQQKLASMKELLALAS